MLLPAKYSHCPPTPFVNHDNTPEKYRSRLMTKPTKLHVHRAKTHISLGIRPVWSESSLSGWRKLGSLATHWVHSETLIRLGRCPAWSESLLGTQSFCWFCHEAVHMIVIILIRNSCPLFLRHIIGCTWLQLVYKLSFSQLFNFISIKILLPGLLIYFKSFASWPSFTDIGKVDIQFYFSPEFNTGQSLYI